MAGKSSSDYNKMGETVTTLTSDMLLTLNLRDQTQKA